MHISCDKREKFYILSVEGKLDAQTAAEFESGIASLLPPEATCVLFDLGGVTYVSSAALRVFLLLAKKTRATDGDMRFAALQPRVAEVFTMAGFTSLFKTGPDVASALSM